MKCAYQGNGRWEAEQFFAGLYRAMHEDYKPPLYRKIVYSGGRYIVMVSYTGWQEIHEGEFLVMDSNGETMIVQPEVFNARFERIND